MKLKKLIRKVFGPKRPKPTLKRLCVPSERTNDSTLTLNNLTPGLIDSVAEKYGYGPITAEFVLLMAERRLHEVIADRWYTLMHLEHALPDFAVPPLTDYDRAILAINVERENEMLMLKAGRAEQAIEINAGRLREMVRLGKYGYRGRGDALVCANCDQVAAQFQAASTALGRCERKDCPVGVILEIIPRPAVAWRRIATRSSNFQKQLTNAERVIALDMDEAQVEEIRERVHASKSFTEDEIQEIKRCVEDWRAHHCHGHGKSAAASAARSNRQSNFLRTSRAANITPAPFDDDEEHATEADAPPLFSFGNHAQPAQQPSKPTDEHQGDEATRPTAADRLRKLAAGATFSDEEAR